MILRKLGEVLKIRQEEEIQHEFPTLHTGQGQGTNMLAESSTGSVVMGQRELKAVLAAGK